LSPGIYLRSRPVKKAPLTAADKNSRGIKLKIFIFNYILVMATLRDKNTAFSSNFHELVYRQILTQSGELKPQYQHYLAELMIDMNDIKLK
jgi:hypothetical protein